MSFEKPPEGEDNKIASLSQAREKRQKEEQQNWDTHIQTLQETTAEIRNALLSERIMNLAVRLQNSTTRNESLENDIQFMRVVLDEKGNQLWGTGKAKEVQLYQKAHRELVDLLRLYEKRIFKK